MTSAKGNTLTENAKLDFIIAKLDEGGGSYTVEFAIDLLKDESQQFNDYIDAQLKLKKGFKSNKVVMELLQNYKKIIAKA